MLRLPPILKKGPRDVVKDIRERCRWASWACLKENC